MKVIRFCYMSPVLENALDRLARRAEEASLCVDVQTIDNAPYVRWLKSSKIMLWNRMVDVFASDDMAFAALMRNLPEYIYGIVDVYLAEQTIYGIPVDSAEVITSCYLCSYEREPSLRSKTMFEHFLMEQQQTYYDYVAFQLVKDIQTARSATFDFCFESHVSHPDGINEIYSKPELEGMREHSKVFLNTDTRPLSFGRAKVEERKNGI